MHIFILNKINYCEYNQIDNFLNYNKKNYKNNKNDKWLTNDKYQDKSTRWQYSANMKLSQQMIVVIDLKNI